MKLQRIHQIHHKGELDRAERLYEEFLKKKRPPMALYLYGTLLLQKNRPGLGVDALRESMKEMPDFVPAHVNLAACYRRLGLLQETLRVCEAAEERFRGRIKEDHQTYYASMLVNHGSALIDLGRQAEAEPLLVQAIEYDKKNKDAYWNLSLAYLSQHNWQEGWPLYEWGFAAQERTARPYYDEIPRWQGEDLTDKRILVWGEQGIGDEILFANCLNDLSKQARKVIFDCHPRLGTLFGRSFPQIDVVPARKDKVYTFDDRDVDFQSPIGSLPAFLRLNDESFPTKGYLRPDRKEVKKWRERIGGDVVVGISWRGGAMKTGQVRRSLTCNDFATMLTMPKHWWPDVKFVSLQYGEGTAEEVEAVNRTYGLDIRHFPGAIEDYTQTADLTAACDLVVSVITAIVHTAGAMDVPVWCLVPENAPWKFQTDIGIWHPSVRTYRQEGEFEWGQAMVRLTRDFNEWLKVRKPPEEP